MSRMPMDWHHECFENASRSLRGRRAEVERLAADLKRYEDDLAFYQQQIATANARRLDGFDRDRFLVKRATR